MRKSVILIVLILITIGLFTGCNNNDTSLNNLNERIDIVQQTNDSNLNDIILQLNNIESSIIQLEEKIMQLEDSRDEIDLKVELLDIEGFENTFEAINNDIDFIEYMIWGRYLFDRSELSVGDNVGEMELTKISGRNRQILQFEGEAYVVGTFGIIEDDFIVGDAVTFNVDKLSGYLPREINDERDLWFRFSNYDEAKAILSKYNTNDEIIIIIDDYLLDLTESAVVNEARLVKVVTEN